MRWWHLYILWCRHNSQFVCRCCMTLPTSRGPTTTTQEPTPPTCSSNFLEQWPPVFEWTITSWLLAAKLSPAVQGTAFNDVKWTNIGQKTGTTTRRGAGMQMLTRWHSTTSLTIPRRNSTWPRMTRWLRRQLKWRWKRMTIARMIDDFF